MGLSVNTVTTAVSKPKHRFNPRVTLYSPPPSNTSNCLVVQMRFFPGSRRSITSPRLIKSQRHFSFDRTFSAMKYPRRHPLSVRMEPAAQVPSLIHSTRQKTAVHLKNRSRDEARRFRGQENRAAREFLDAPKPPHRGTQQQFLAPRRAVQQFFIQRSAEYAGHNGVYANAVRRPFHRQGARQRRQPRLAGAVSRHFIHPEKRCERRNIDDAPVLSLHHVASKNLARSVRPGQIGLENLAPLALSHLKKRCALRAPRCVDHDVRLAEFCHRRIKQTLKRRAIQHIGTHSQGAPPEPLNFLRGGLYHLRAPRTRNHVRSQIG